MIFIDQVVNEVGMSRENQKELMKQNIYHSALKLFGANTYDKCSINMICKDAQISKGIVYHHYKDKDELYNFCVENSIQHYLNYLESNLSFGMTFEENLESYFQVRFDYFNSGEAESMVFQKALYNTPTHLVTTFQKQHKIVADYNTSLLKRWFQEVDLQAGLTPLEVVDYFSKVMDSYQRQTEEVMTLQEQENQMKKIINMICYGVLRR